MSSFADWTLHPRTGEFQMAEWLDDYFGRHEYGVRFEGDDTVYRGEECVRREGPDDN